MDERLERLERRLEELAQTCQELGQRLDRVESGLATSAASAASALSAPLEAEVGAASGAAEAERLAERPARATRPPRAQRVSALVGRSFVVLGGAFYLRALTDGGTVSERVGVSLGLSYALVWMVMADRSAGAGRALSTAFHGLTAAFIAFPLIWEAATAFEVVGPYGSAALLLGFSAIGLGVAWRWGQPSVAWIVVLFATVTGIGLFFFSHAAITAVAAVWVANRHGWPGLPWPGTVAADLLVLFISLVVLSEDRTWIEPGPALYAQLALVLPFFATFAHRHVVRQRAVSVFDGLQMLIGLALALVLAPAVAGELGATWPFPAAAFLAGAAGYVVGARAHRRHQAQTGHAYSALGSLSLVCGLALLPWAWVATLLLAAAGLLLGWLAATGRVRVTFRLHAAFFAASAVLAAGLGGAILDAFTASASATWRAVDGRALVVLATVVALYVVLRRGREEIRPAWIRVASELVVLLIALASFGTGLIGALAEPIAQAGTSQADGGALAVLRTAFLSLTACSVSVTARLPGEGDLRRLVRPLLLILVLKFIVEDVGLGRPGTLFLSLLFLGLALIVAARTSRKLVDAEGESASGPPALDEETDGSGAPGPDEDAKPATTPEAGGGKPSGSSGEPVETPP
jgi:hypothetical protein